MSIIEQREAAKEARRAAVLEDFNRAEVLEGRVVQAEGRTLQINAVKPLAIKRPKAVAPEQDAQREWLAKEWARWEAREASLIREQISLGANVYGDAYSEITWRDVETGATFEVWTNVSLNYLRPLTSIREGDYAYSYFGFITPYTREDERLRMEAARARGLKLESRWKKPPVKLSAERDEYVVVAQDGRAVPAKLYRQLDALFGYYDAHKEELKVAWKNAQTLRAAREKYLEKNPPQPRETRVNFWKIEE